MATIYHAVSPGLHFKSKKVCRDVTMVIRWACECNANGSVFVAATQKKVAARLEMCRVVLVGVFVGMPVALNNMLKS